MLFEVDFTIDSELQTIESFAFANSKLEKKSKFLVFKDCENITKVEFSEDSNHLRTHQLIVFLSHQKSKSLKNDGARTL